MEGAGRVSGQGSRMGRESGARKLEWVPPLGRRTAPSQAACRGGGCSAAAACECQMSVEGMHLA